MNKDILTVGLNSALYFSSGSFIILFIAGILFDFLKKTTGSLSLEAVIGVCFTIILIMFALSMANILLKDPEKGIVSWTDRLLSVIIFLAVSSLVLGILIALFLFQM